MTRLLFETDWLASHPVFYNERTGKASHSINDVIDYENLEFDPEGFNNFLDFGYSVFEQTPIKHVKFLRHSARLLVDDQGRLTVKYLPDPAKDRLNKRCAEEDVLDLLQSKVRQWERSCSGRIIIPTSGGYDSRLLNLLIEDKSRIRSFTYGISPRQSESYEVVYAQRLAHILGTMWEQVVLNNFHRYFEEWDELYGVSTHAHGMYHIDLYRQIKSRVDTESPLLSGIVGDAWAGIFVDMIDCPGDVPRLGYTHGIHASSSASRLTSKNGAVERYYEMKRQELLDPRMRIVELVRFKIILLSYLMRVPGYLGFKPWSPFLDIDVAMSMLNLPSVRRKERIWQRDYFRKNGVDLASMDLKGSNQNNLDLQGIRHVTPPPLDATLLSEIVEPAYVDWINKNVCRRHRSRELFVNSETFCRIWARLEREGIGSQQQLAYNAYITLKPIENILKRRSGGFCHRPS